MLFLSCIHITLKSNFNFLQPNSPNDLFRIGSNFDGGYILSRQNVSDTESLLSFGLGSNIDFEYDLFKLKKRDFNIHVYDHTHQYLGINSLIEAIKRCLRFKSHKPFYYHLIFLLKYHRFFFGRHRLHYFEKIGTKGTNLVTSIARLGAKNNIGVKIDIESSEYEILSELIAYSDSFSFLIIEFHEVNRHKDLIESFCQNLQIYGGMKLFHLHANNFSEVGSLGIPDVLELTFGRESNLMNLSYAFKLPNESLDAPNSPIRNDYCLEWEF
jgi:hypothetical protein